MPNFTKNILLLLAGLLALSGVLAGQGVQVVCDLSQAVAAEQTQASFSAGESVKFPSLIRTEEQLSLGHHLPGPPSKTPSGELYFRSFAAELHIQRTVARYISRSANICRSLATGDIIFPFHYFW